eukprot:10717410-Alexandrium_andersonii.AAC.1
MLRSGCARTPYDGLGNSVTHAPLLPPLSICPHRYSGPCSFAQSLEILPPNLTQTAARLRRARDRGTTEMEQ